MNGVFLRFFMTGAVMTLPMALIMLLRALFPHASRRLFCAVWRLAAIRLIIPFSIFDLAIGGSAPAASSPVTAFSHVDGAIGGAVTAAIDIPAPKTGISILSIIAAVWAYGAALLLILMLIRLVMLKKSLSFATLFRDNVFRSDRISEPIAFGLIKPKIYLPYSVSESGAGYAVLHEKEHLRKRDDISLILFRAIAAVYWFDPFIWAAYAMFRSDIEIACDERATAGMDRNERRDYCTALLNCSAGMSPLTPVAHFGGKRLERRISFIMDRKGNKTLVLVILAALLILTVGCTAAAPITQLSASAGKGDIVSAKPYDYKKLDTSNGLRVLVTKTGNGSWSCYLAPGEGTIMKLEDALAFSSLSAEDAKEMIAALGADPSMVSIHPYRSPLSSYAYKVNDEYYEEISRLFDGKYPVGAEVYLRDFTDLNEN